MGDRHRKGGILTWHRWVPATLIATVALAVAAAPVLGQSDEVRSCVEQNLVRYSDPDSSAAAQYLDVEVECTRALEDTGAEATLTPAPDAPPSNPPDDGSNPDELAAPPAGDGSSDQGQPPSGSEGTSPGDDSPAEQADQADQADQAKDTTDTAQTDQVSPQAVIASPPTSASAPSPLSGMPAWAIAVLAAAGVGVITSAAARLWRRNA